MSSLMVANSYGKSQIRLVQLSPDSGMRQITVSVELTGDFANAYLLGDSSHSHTLPLIAVHRRNGEADPN